MFNSSTQKVIISGYYGFENLGDELILSILIEQLQSKGYAPVVLSGNPDATTKAYGVEAIERTHIHHIWQAMADAKAFISGGGGLFQDVTGPASPCYYGGLIELARIKRLPVAFFAQGIGPLKSWLGKELTKRALSQSQLIVVRDVQSLAFIKQFMGQTPVGKKAFVMGDPVWLRAFQPEIEDVPVKRLGISLRSWPDLTDETIVHLGQCIAKLPNILETGVNLIDCQAGADIVPLAKLEKVLKDHRISYYWCMGDNAVAGIQSSYAVLAMRFHAVLLAAQLGVPVMAVSYDPKIEIIAAQLKIRNVPVSALNILTPDALDQGFDHADSSAIESFQSAAQHGFTALINWLGNN